MVENKDMVSNTSLCKADLLDFFFLCYINKIKRPKPEKRIKYFPGIENVYPKVSNEL